MDTHRRAESRTRSRQPQFSLLIGPGDYFLCIFFFSQERGELYFGNEDKDEFLDIFMKTSNPTLIHEESCSDKPERGDFSLILDICFSLVLRSATTAKTRTTTIPLPM